MQAFSKSPLLGPLLNTNKVSIEEILHAGPLLTSAWFAPLCVGGLILATVGGLVLHLLSGRM
jgi:hypothetical protein